MLFLSTFIIYFSMLLPKLRRAAKYAVIGLTGLGGAYLIQKNDWEISTLGVVRFGRTAVAVIQILI